MHPLHSTSPSFMFEQASQNQHFRVPHGMSGILNSVSRLIQRPFLQKKKNPQGTVSLLQIGKQNSAVSHLHHPSTPLFSTFPTQTQDHHHSQVVFVLAWNDE